MMQGPAVCLTLHLFLGGRSLSACFAQPGCQRRVTLVVNQLSYPCRGDAASRLLVAAPRTPLELLILLP